MVKDIQNICNSSFNKHSVHESCWDFTGQLVRQSLRVYLTEQIFTWPKKINKFHSLTNVFITYMYKQQ